MIDSDGVELCYGPVVHQPGSIDVEDVQSAIKLVEYFKSHLNLVAHHMTSGIANADARHIINWIKRKQLATFRKSDVCADLRRFRENAKTLAAAPGPLWKPE